MVEGNLAGNTNALRNAVGRPAETTAAGLIAVPAEMKDVRLHKRATGAAVGGFRVPGREAWIAFAVLEPGTIVVLHWEETVATALEPGYPTRDQEEEAAAHAQGSDRTGLADAIDQTQEGHTGVSVPVAIFSLVLSLRKTKRFITRRGHSSRKRDDASRRCSTPQWPRR